MSKSKSKYVTFRYTRYTDETRPYAAAPSLHPLDNDARGIKEGVEHVPERHRKLEFLPLIRCNMVEVGKAEFRRQFQLREIVVRSKTRSKSLTVAQLETWSFRLDWQA